MFDQVVEPHNSFLGLTRRRVSLRRGGGFLIRKEYDD